MGTNKWLKRLTVALVGAALVSACQVEQLSEPEPSNQTPPPAVSASPGPVTTPSSQSSPSGQARHHRRHKRPKRTDVRPAAPQHLSIPSVGISAAVGRISVTYEGDQPILAPPEATWADLLRAYWWQQRSAPGYPNSGTTFIIGHTCHVANCPAVFNRLQQISRGDLITVITANGRLTYRVFRRQTFQKADVKYAKEVYADVPDTLVLATCKLRRDGGLQTDNFVAWAKLVGSRRT